MSLSVIDASVLASLLLDEPVADAADAVLGPRRSALAPDYALTECANAIWKHFMRGEIEADGAMIRLMELEKYPIDTVDTPDLLPGALMLAMRSGHALYDCIYVALAQQEDAELITADARQAAVAREAGVRVRLLEG